MYVCVCADRRLYRLGVALVFLSISSSLAVHHDCLSQPYFSAFLLYLFHLAQYPTLTFFYIFISVIRLSSINSLEPALVKASISLTVPLHAFARLCAFSYVSSHTLCLFWQRARVHSKGVFTVKLVPMLLQSVLACDEDRRGEVLEKW